jgi:serine/threonine-protein phosphatase 4 regulatory subunit 1
MTSAALIDKFAAVREAAIKSVPSSFQILQKTAFEAPYRDMITDLSNASSFRQRVTFTRCLKEFIKPPPHREPFERFFAHALPRLRTDVVDVRIALAQMVAALFVVGGYYESDTDIPPVISQLAQALADDDSADVRNAVRHIDMDRLRKGKENAPNLDEAPNVSGRPTGEEYRRAAGARTQSSEVNGDAPGRPPISNSKDHEHDSNSTPRVGQHNEPHKVVDPFAASFQDAVRETDGEQ